MIRSYEDYAENLSNRARGSALEHADLNWATANAARVVGAHEGKLSTMQYLLNPELYFSLRKQSRAGRTIYQPYDFTEEEIEHFETVMSTAKSIEDKE